MPEYRRLTGRFSGPPNYRRRLVLFGIGAVIAAAVAITFGRLSTQPARHTATAKANILNPMQAVEAALNTPPANPAQRLAWAKTEGKIGAEMAHGYLDVRTGIVTRSGHALIRNGRGVYRIERQRFVGGCADNSACWAAYYALHPGG